MASSINFGVQIVFIFSTNWLLNGMDVYFHLSTMVDYDRLYQTSESQANKFPAFHPQ